MTRLALGTERSVSRRPAEASLISSALRPKLSADVRRELFRNLESSSCPRSAGSWLPVLVGSSSVGVSCAFSIEAAVVSGPSFHRSNTAETTDAFR